MKNRIFRNSPFFDEAAQMPVDKDVFAFRMRQRNDFLFLAEEPKSFIMQIQKIESFSWPSTPVCAGNAFRCECLSDRSGGEIAEQPIG